MVSGTERNIPTEPKIQPQKINDRKTTKVDRPSIFPINFGSRKFPTTVLAKRNVKAVQRTAAGPICTKARIIGGIAAMIEPIFGI